MDGLVAYALAKKIALGAVSGISNILMNGNQLVFQFKDGTSSSMLIPLPEDGKDGKDGAIPSIGSNGNWYIDDTDTGISAVGEDGISVSNIEIKDNHLICTLSNGTEIDAGEIALDIGLATNNDINNLFT